MPILARLIILGTIACLSSTSVNAAAGGLRHLLINSTNTTFNITDTNTTNTTSVPSADELNVDPDFVQNNTEVIPPEDDSDVPTEAPTPVPVPPNDECTNAQVLPVTSGSPNMPSTSFTSGTTIGANRDKVGCRRGWLVSPGVWYTVQGTGDFMMVSTCSPNTQLDTTVRVMKGSCDVQECVTHNDDASGSYACEAQPSASRVTWKSENGATYYILVHGRGFRYTGTFDISVTSYPLNDNCPSAHEMPLAFPVPGDTTDSRMNAADTLGECGYDSKDYEGEWSGKYGKRYPRALYYAVQGTGNRFRATTCKANGPTLFLAHRLHVFEGSCGSCVGGNENPISCVTYEWSTTLGTMYYVAIHRTYPAEDEDNEDNVPPTIRPETNMPAPFELTITEVDTVSISRRKELFD